MTLGRVVPGAEPLFPIRLLALDIDGTLVGDDLVIGPRTRAAARMTRSAECLAAETTALSLNAYGGDRVLPFDGGHGSR